jgi:transcriptional regulator with XRE-family HTH domain
MPPYCALEHNRAMLVYDPSKIVALREEKGWNQAELARRARLSQPTVWAIEHGRTRNVKYDTLRAIAGALGVPLAAILAARVGLDGSDATERVLAALEALDDDGRATLAAIAQTLVTPPKRR